MGGPAAAFFRATGERAYAATGLTRGPWSAQHQHAGPPAALLAREVERGLPGAMQVVRFTVELLRPIPIAPLAVSSQVLRTGRSAHWAVAELSGGGELLARATALAIRSADVPVPAAGDPHADPVPAPGDSAPFDFPFFAADEGYHTAMELRRARGRYGEGPVAMWMRMRCPLVEGEAPTPLQRVVTAADSGNGVSAVLDTARYTFVNPDLTVYLHRRPEGEWICLDARTIPQADGRGLADTRLLDERGPVGHSLQSLLIDRRDRGVASRGTLGRNERWQEP